ncbi:acyl-CoA carboxylase subunit epsilon [Corynebacterium sp. sy017]|uniref:acyl-CoA carboxylase subunit epsilon n=1 Tax=unclassified Corynebacterium TaxID=2624378 RepID=UPI0011870689|nr:MULTISPECIES: acyl-CoA carboxylase subunit epsilon [unclassified Corynebacterium]MBP3088705.1 acyl-CoA carboxylase subunit epsilon [Corynebacterium sp. sy017]QDZ42106.1 acyl-CoA carboxylase subunit epsilon [Corynebacterium sp. sy039]TSD91992.1 acyl-CoA carboxylase subunit epsilon [Corynebacterium sp. SY003]
MSEKENTEAQQPEKQPFLRVLKGNPSASEVAALTVLFAGLAQSSSQELERERNLWGNIEERLRKPATYNPTAFRNVSFF